LTPSEEKVLQYLNEARASELALVSALRTHLAMAPSGSYRGVLERHLEETKAHARRVQARIAELGAHRSPMRLGVGLAQAVMGQAVALVKGPLDLVRGYSLEEKLLKNAKDDYAAEAHEIATYLALERLADEVGDATTAALAREIRGDEERMLARLGEEIPGLVEAMARAELARDPSLDATRADGEPARRPTAATENEPAPAPPPAADASVGASPGAPASSAATPDMPPAPFPVASGESDLPIEGYGGLRVADLLPRLAGLSPEDLDRVEEYERGHRARSTVLARISALRQRGAPPPSA
jgi:ferritin-like metal-binding protein YciE